MVQKLKKAKRAQITIFIAIGLILLFFFAVVFSIKSLPVLQSKTRPNNIETFMQECMEIKAKEILKYAGQTGGQFREDVLFTAFVNSSNFASLENIKSTISAQLGGGGFPSA